MMKMKQNKLYNIKKIFFLLLLIPFLFSMPQETYAASKPTISLSDAIIADLALRNYLDYISIYYQDRKSSNTISLNPAKQWIPASTIKLFVALYAFDQIAKKNISLDDQITIDDKNVVPTELETDAFPVLTPGLTTTIDILLQKMITQSDNTAYNTLLDVLDRQKITAYVQNIGLSHTIVGSKLNLDDDQTQYEFTTPGYNINTTTAQDYAKAYELLDKNKLPLSKSLLVILSQQKINTMLPALLPKTLTIEHKTGDLDPLYHDGGIILGNNHHYILTIFTNLGNPNILAHISDLVYTQNYALVGAAIPDKNDSFKQNNLQAMDNLVLHPPQAQVLGATAPINIPLPQITAADLGISQKDISLAIAEKDLPQPFLPPLLNDLWFGLQKAVVVGEKARQQVALSYAKSELARAFSLTRQGKQQEATQTLRFVSQVVKLVAKDPHSPPDEATQLTLQSLSDTEFVVFHNQLTKATTDTQRAALIATIAQEARSNLTDVEPHIASAKATASLAQQPLIGTIVETAKDHIVVETAGGQQITIPLTPSLKIKDEGQIASKTIAPSPETKTSPALPSPTTAPKHTEQFIKGASIAILGDTRGKVAVPSLIINNIPQEIAAPHPVVVVKINTKNHTMVVNDNGNVVQVDLTPQTAIKAKDTNIEFDSIKSGSVVVVHGNLVQPVHSDSQVPTGSSSVKIPFVARPQKSQTPTPTLPLSPTSQTAKTLPQTSDNILSPSSILPPTAFTPSPTAASSATVTITPTTTSPAQPEVIKATTIQVIQESSNPKPESKPQEGKPTNKTDTQSSHPPQPSQLPTSQNGKGNGK